VRRVGVDALTGRQMWSAALNLPVDVGAMVCCGAELNPPAMMNAMRP
jgi:hypothetical protein